MRNGINNLIAPTVELAKELKKGEISSARWVAETGGTDINGLYIDTSRESQSLITGAALQATLDNSYVCHWKTAQGFVELSARQIIFAAQAVRAHVQACFDKEAELIGSVEEAETIEAVQGIRWE